MRRREFITLLGGAAALQPLAARAQQAAMPVIGYLDGAATSQRTEFVAAFRQGLKEAGFIEGQNVAIEFRSANGQAERLPDMAADLVRRQAAVILSTGGMPSIVAAKAASPTMPIVVVFGGDPVKVGLIASLNHPGGNITGATFVSAELAGKQLELICQLVPSATTIAFLSQPDDRDNAEAQRNAIVVAGQAQGRKIIVLEIRNDGDFEDAFASIVPRGAGALAVGIFPLFASNRGRLIALAAQYKVPTIYQYREFTSNGGLMSYGGRATDSFRLGGDYVGQILKGVKPADLPFLLPTKFDLVINLTTAKTLGLIIPPTLLSLADEVIE
jgi:putative ABC transport system substrate-binding protein